MSTVVKPAPKVPSDGSFVGKDPVEKMDDPGQQGWPCLNVKAMDGSQAHTYSCPPSTSPLRQKNVNLRNFARKTRDVDSLHHKAVTCEAPCSEKRCRGSIVVASNRSGSLPRPTTEVQKQAKEFIAQYYAHINRSATDSHTLRQKEVGASIETTGTYHLTEAELVYGAKLAWRNAARCIGRIQWAKLQVFDARTVRNTRGMLEIICKHLLYSTNKGDIRSAITVFPPRTDGQHDFRIWNTTLIMYAGYEQEDGTVIGDPQSVEFTQVCQKLGWKGSGGRFDILPLVLQANGEDPEWFDIPEECAMQVPLSHPQFDWFAELGLKWNAVPAVSNMILDVGGLEFTGCPFSGWFMSTEIGARNLCDVHRYNQLETIALKMGLDTTTNISLWKDKAMVEANVAVLHSYQKAEVTIVDHHTASESFIGHMKNEQESRGGCPADWVWIVPPMSASACPVFHQEMLLYNLKPSFEYQEQAWKTHVWKTIDEPDHVTTKKTFREVAEAVRFVARLMIRALSKRFKATIMYATESGRSKTYAERVHRMFNTAFNAKMVRMDDYDFAHLEHEDLLIVVTSTTGDGDPPENAQAFARYLIAKAQEQRKITNRYLNREFEEDDDDLFLTETFYNQPKRIAPRTLRQISVTSMEEANHILSAVRFGVFGLGSSAYPKFCAFAHAVDELLEVLGAERLSEIGEGDELGGQEIAFKNWAKEIFQVSCETFCIGSDVNVENVMASISMPDDTWAAEKYRVVAADYQANPADLCSTLASFHGHAVYSCKFKSRTNLLSPLSRRSTILVKLDTQDQDDLAFEPGDHVAIFPTNDKELVERILRRISYDKPFDVVVKVDRHEAKVTELGTVRKWIAHNRLPACSIRYALLHLLDITSTPSPIILKTFSTHARSPLEQKQLAMLGEGSAVYDDVCSSFANLAEILEAFPTLRLPASLLLTLLPPLRARLYSVSSSPRLYPGEIQLTLAVIQYKCQGHGAIHRGVCSTWLDELTEGDIVPAFIRRAPSFHMPANKSAPMILVGPGTGIAPYRSFWQHRCSELEQRSPQEKNTGNEEGAISRLGDAILVFGCRHSKLDILYKEEREAMEASGALNANWTALSREVQLPKTYVQDLLRKHSAKVYETLCKSKGHIYVCGDIGMAVGVRATIESIVAEHGDLHEDRAKEMTRRIEKENRYHEDIFDVTLRTAEVLQKLRDIKRQASGDQGKTRLTMSYFMGLSAAARQRTESAEPTMSPKQSNAVKKGRDRKLSEPLPFRNRALQSY